MKTSTTIAAVCMAIAGVAVNAEHTSRELILGALPIEKGTKKYVAGLRDDTDESSYCGGVLVAPKFVATTKICLDIRVPTHVTIGTGFQSQTSDGERIKIASIHVHPKFNYTYNSYNFVLLKLAEPSKFSAISLPSAADAKFRDNVPATALGWGIPDFPGHDGLLAVNMSVWGGNVCQSYQEVDETNMCAGRVSTVKDPCIYSGGGPLIKEHEKGDKDDILFGLLVQHEGCGGDNSPDIFSRVTSAVEWFEFMFSSI